ncbi:hypothetical protein N7519_000863 [Penicillium mononematosum]|uniref:uncharacterized protein n=1 Tax=Penicillium mononematosum TaxID=268346 RepID=UPI002547E692|nr:uncharacterized protein N7519_000863 [Penicillium mononematosum]KAJ6190842.1 hypothetical protein N7519_000863 [Penicillium mononematosum]
MAHRISRAHSMCSRFSGNCQENLMIILRDKEEFYRGRSEYGSWQCHLIKLTDEGGTFGLCRRA